MTDFANPDPDSTTSAPVASNMAARPPRKRRRPAVVCAECRRRKIACDRKTPCGQCALHNVECVYATGSVPPPYGRPIRLPPSPGSLPGGDAPDAKTAAESHEASSLDEDAAANESKMIPSLGERSIRFGGRLAKTRLFGRTHWMNNIDQFKDIHALTHLIHLVAGANLLKSLRTCKRLARLIKTDERRRIAQPAKENGAEWFTPPPRAVCDRLVDLYFNSFESVFRVLHLTTFLREYRQFWHHGTTTVEPDTPPSDVFMVKLILVLAMGSCFYDGPEELHVSLRFAATRAVRRMDVVACTPVEKNRLSLDMLQVYCLAILARQSTALEIGDDLTWFTTGSLLHTAFGMGLNRDPSNFRSLSFFQCEMRRRLWATVLELVVQSSLDQGMPPLISADDYDCLPPTNLNDDEIGDTDDSSDNCCKNGHCGNKRDASGSPDGKRPSLKGHPDTTFTQTSMQRLLCRSLPLRLRITKALNGLGPGLTYERALQMSADLLEACRYAATTLKAAALMVTVESRERASFARLRVLFYEVLTRRFHHSLHSPFARKAGSNVQFFYSRRARIESAVKILSLFRPPTSSDASVAESMMDFNAPLSKSNGDSIHSLSRDVRRRRPPTHKAVDDPCWQLAMIGRGFVKCTLIDLQATVGIEMILQLSEDFFPGADLSMSQRELYGTACTCLSLLRGRVEAGETNVKGYIFFCGGLAQIDALMAGRNVREGITDAVHHATENMVETLRALATRRGVPVPEILSCCAGNGEDMDPSLTISPVALQTANVLGLGIEEDAALAALNGAGPLFGDQEVDGISVDVNSSVHMPSLSATGSSSGTWTEDLIVDPQGDFGSSNWFYPYNEFMGMEF